MGSSPSRSSAQNVRESDAAVPGKDAGSNVANLQSSRTQSHQTSQGGVLDKIVFLINGTETTVHNPDPKMSLNEWIRGQPGLKGTKVMCQEGGCGCCVVALTRADPLAGKNVTLAVNSCLFPLCSADGCEVTTTEGIGNHGDGLNPVQKRLAEHNGSQCGYCSPGMVMNMYSFLKQNPKPDKQQIEDIFDGNICRCTGYRPILDAMKSFAAEESPIDIEDLNKCTGQCDGCPQKKTCMHIPTGTEPQWYSVASLSDLYAIMDKEPEKSVRLVAGNTGKGVYKEDGPFDVMIDISKLQELRHVKEDDGHLVLGGGLPLNDVIRILGEKAEKSASFGAISEHLKKVANTPVRNVGSVAGNLMLAHAHPDFPSDVLTIMEAAGATLLIGSSTSTSAQHSLMDFLKLDMNRKVIIGIAIPIRPDVVFKTFKITARAQNTHAYVNAGFAVTLDKTTMTAKSPARIVYGGIRANSIHAVKTEQFLDGKVLTDPETLKGALELLEQEVQPDAEILEGSSAEYHKNLALSLFYKFYVAALGDQASPQVRSAGSSLVRHVSSGEQSYETKPENYPVTQPLTKLAAKLQASGEAQYTNDLPSIEGEVYGALVLSTLANCKIDKIDPSDALKKPGVIKFICASDLPPGVKNYCPQPYDFDAKHVPEVLYLQPGDYTGSGMWIPYCTLLTRRCFQLFSSGAIYYAGQVLGLIIADTQRHADEAAKAVTVTYKDAQPPILTLAEAIEAKSFHAKLPFMADVTRGDADAAFASAAHVITGEISCGAQKHFHLETQTAMCVPDEDFLTVYSATQSTDNVQLGISASLGIPAKRIVVVTRRLGGSFGGKLKTASKVAVISALAAKMLKRPVRLNVNFNTNMRTVGNRAPYLAKYKIGVDDSGKLLAIEAAYYVDDGCCLNDTNILNALGHWDNVYFCPNWNISMTSCFTHTAGSAWCRGPGEIQLVFMMESMMEHVAKAMNKSPEEIRFLNLYQPDQLTPTGKPVLFCNISTLWKDLLESAEFEKRKVAMDEFNKANRWRKRGLSVVPGRYNIRSYFAKHTVMVSIYHGDGTVAVTHGGIEMGQGINVKVAQVTARELGIPLDYIAIKEPTTITSPNSFPTGASVSSEVNCKGAMECCKILNDRIAPIRETMKDASWQELIKACYQKNVDLSVQHLAVGQPVDKNYSAYGVVCTEVEVDVLTGQREILRSDILYDCGESINPEVDIGQVEGGFVFGLGYWLTESVRYDRATGREISDGTWNYTPPSSKDIPADLRISLLKNTPNPVGILRSKASGEPPLLMSCSGLFAVKRAVESFRADVGKDQYFPLNGPCTVEKTQLSCEVEPKHFTL